MAGRAAGPEDDWVGRPPGARHLVLFDGLCGLCDRLVARLVRADRRGVLAFAPLQGETRRSIERRLGVRLPEETIVLVEHWRGERERLLVRSDAVCAIAAALGRGWRLLVPLRLLPRRLRDAGYDFVARRRSRWFGRLEACRVPAAHERERFLD